MKNNNTIAEFEKGQTYSKKSKYSTTYSRRWTESEMIYLCELYNNGLSVNKISKLLGRSIPSVRMKIKRLKKKNGNYNSEHDIEKHKINKAFVEYLKPKMVLDLYSGKNGITEAYTNYHTITNDINPDYSCDFHYDALKLLSLLYGTGIGNFDLIDLDPFGSAYDCFDLAIKLVQNGLCITFGELGHKRFKRLDYVKHRYGFNNLDDFTLDNMIKHVQGIGYNNKKELIVWDKKLWSNIGRVWFVVKKHKKVEQWSSRK